MFLLLVAPAGLVLVLNEINQQVSLVLVVNHTDLFLFAQSPQLFLTAKGTSPLFLFWLYIFEIIIIKNN